MSPEAADWWERALRDLESAARELPYNADLAAARAYYATFYALTAFFAMEGKTFTKHSAVRDALHREVIRAGVLSAEAGRDYDELRHLRAVGDYGGGIHVDVGIAADALAKAHRFVEAIRAIKPEFR